MAPYIFRKLRIIWRPPLGQDALRVELDALNGLGADGRRPMIIGATPPLALGASGNHKLPGQRIPLATISECK